MISNHRASMRRVAVAATGALGLLAVAGGILAAPAFADGASETAAAVASHQAPLAAGTPCITTAKACVDLESEKAWLIKDGKVMRGPVKISSGGNGKETPVGHSLRVYRKEQDHKSQESRLPNGQPAPMPWSVFFEDGGIAFHGGSPSRSSAGCIHLATADAKAWFDYLQIGDQVQVVRASQELAARKAEANGGTAPEQGNNGGSDSNGDDAGSSHDDSSDDD
jgi:lipoprotein-anchoring transpeptidase ErfK/SrfK